MKGLGRVLLVTAIVFVVLGCLGKPMSPNILEKMFFVPSQETIYVSISPPPPAGTIVKYSILSSDETVLIIGQRSFQKRLEFYFPKEWQPYYLSLELILPDGLASENYRRVIRRNQVKISRFQP
jgi:hypothetical protein